MSLAAREYTVLRRTIASRGTTRMVLVPLTFIAWAALGTALIISRQVSLAALFPLAVLAAGFEAIHALHIGVERIGRYLQVFYEESSEDDGCARPRWETTAMAGRPGLPGGGADPLFTVLFSSAVILNLTLGLVRGPTAMGIGVVGTPHVILLARIVQARRAAARQRQRDLEHYRALRDAGAHAGQ